MPIVSFGAYLQSKLAATTSWTASVTISGGGQSHTMTGIDIAGGTALFTSGDGNTYTNGSGADITLTSVSLNDGTNTGSFTLDPTISVQNNYSVEFTSLTLSIS